jgi:hypothetical protein
MKLILTKKDLEDNFEFYKDQIAPRGSVISSIAFKDSGGIAYLIDEIEISFEKENTDEKVQPK